MTSEIIATNNMLICICLPSTDCFWRKASFTYCDTRTLHVIHWWRHRRSKEFSLCVFRFCWAQRYICSGSLSFSLWPRTLSHSRAYTYQRLNIIVFGVCFLLTNSSHFAQIMFPFVSFIHCTNTHTQPQPTERNAKSQTRELSKSFSPL